MPDPNDVPVSGSGLPQENAPQQPQYNGQQPQYNYQQPQQPQQPQYNYQQAQQPQYNYQQSQQPQYNYQQPQQPQYNYQQAQQPQYGYRQAPQPYSYQPAPYRQPQAAAPVTHKKAVASMVMIILAITFLAYPLIVSLVNYFDSAFSYGGRSWLYLMVSLCWFAAVVLMLVGAIIGSRGHKLFGIGLLILFAIQIYSYILTVISMWDYYDEGINVLLLLFGVILVTGTLLAGIGCLARVKPLKIVGGILMLVNWPIVWIFDFGSTLDMYRYFRSSGLVLTYLLYLIGFIFICIAVLCFPIRKPRD